MKVLHILGSAGAGGIERLVLQLIGAQAVTREIQPGVFLAFPRGAWLDQFHGLGVPCITAGLKSGYDWRPTVFRKARRIFMDYDILHFHSFNYLLAAAAIQSKKTIVYTEHGNFGFGRRTRLSDRVTHFLKGRFLRRDVSKMTFNSNFTAEYARKRYHLGDSRGRVVYNGVDFVKIDPRPERVDPLIQEYIRKRFVVGTSSRFAGFKRIDRLIDGFAEFQQGRDTVLLLVGDGPLRRELQTRVEKLGIREKVVFAGMQDNVFDYQDLMDVCVFPSRDEPFGLVVLETLFLGKPTVVFNDGGGIREIVEPAFPDDSVDGTDGLVRRLDFYLNQPEYISNTKKSRKERALEFSMVRCASQFNEVYMSVI